ncbi:MAG: translocation/assembly module TamB domain-containing protein [Spirochaetia bacterium]
MKKLATAAGVLVLIVLFLVVTLLLSVLHPWVQMRLAEHVLTGLSERSGASIAIERIYVRPSGVFRLSGVSVAGADGLPLMAIDQGRGSINFPALLQRRVELDFLQLSGVELNVRRDENGELNVADFARSLSSGVTDADGSGEGPEATEAKPWSARFTNVALLDGDVELSLASDSRRTVHAEGVSLSIDSAAISQAGLSLRLRGLSVQSLNGVEIDHGELMVTASPREMRVDRLVLESPSGSLSLSGRMESGNGSEGGESREGGEGGEDRGFPPLAADTRIELSLEEASLEADAVDRLLPLVPPWVREAIGELPEGTGIYAAGSAAGTVEGIRLRSVDVRVGDVAHLLAAGRVRGLVNGEELDYELAVERLELEFPRETAPLTWARVSGTLSGSRSAARVQLSGESSAGEGHFAGSLEPLPATPGAQLGGDLSHAVCAEVRFREKLELALDGSIERRGAVPRYRGVLQLGYADLSGLGVSETEVELSGNADFDISFASLTQVEAAVDLTEVGVRGPERAHRLDRLRLEASGTAHASSLSVDSDILRVGFVSDLPFITAAEEIDRLILSPTALARRPVTESLSGTIELDVESPESPALLVALVPRLDELSPFTAHITLDGARDRLDGRLEIERLMVDGYGAADVRVGLEGLSTSLSYSVSAADLIGQGATLNSLGRTSVRGSVRGPVVSAFLELDGDDGEELLRLGVRGTVEKDRTLVRVAPGVVRVRSFPLRVSESHSIAIDDERVEIASLSLSHEDTFSATIDGEYRFAAREIELLASLDRFDLGYLTEFLPEEVSDTRGYLVGTIEARGPVSAPQLDGRLSFQDTGFRVAELGTSFSIGSESIEVRDGVVRFSGFTIRDRNGNPAEITGTISTAGEPEGPASSVTVDLHVRSDRFLLLDTASERRRGFRGTLIVDSDLRISGSRLQPRGSGTVGLRSGSTLTVVLSDPDGAVADAEGVVRFTDLPDEAETDEPELTAQTVFRGVDVSAALRIDPATSVDVVVDADSGDRLRMRGGGDLTLGIDPSGTLSLTGRYAVEEGSYLLSFYNVARREFQIVPGSDLVWSGDPLDAALDMEALYTVRASVSPLLSPRGVEYERASPAGELPFHAVLLMQGTLREPEIEFSLDMPPQQRNAMGGLPYAAILEINEQESRRNAQAFSLIVLNQFIGEDISHIDEAAVGGLGARRSASRLLTHQLNALSRRIITGVDLSFEVESYEQYGPEGPEGRTELGVELSRRLLDERLILRFGGRIDVEGRDSRETSPSNIPGDVSVEYLLTPDGRYRLRGFRERDYRGPLEGSSTATGLSFMFTRTFDRLFPSRSESGTQADKGEREGP